MELVGGRPGSSITNVPTTSTSIEMLRAQRAVFAQAVGAVVSNIGVVGQAVLTGALLFHIHPVLLGLPLLNLVAFLTESKSGALIVEASEASAADTRLAREHFSTATSYGFAKEVRVFGLATEIVGRHRKASDGPPAHGVGQLEARGVGGGRRVHRHQRPDGRHRLRRVAGAEESGTARGRRSGPHHAAHFPAQRPDRRHRPGHRPAQSDPAGRPAPPLAPRLRQGRSQAARRAGPPPPHAEGRDRPRGRVLHLPGHRSPRSCPTSPC